MRKALNAALLRATGYELRRAGSSGRRSRQDRLVRAPVFILSTVRSGSTLLRVLLDSHPQLYAPPELHFRYIAVRLTRKWSRRSMHELGLDARSLEYLLWDRILDRELARSGKQRIVCKTPDDVFIADRLRACWPDARFLFLLRHPAEIARSRGMLRAGADHERNVAFVRDYCETLEAVRSANPGHTVRYEELTADPAGVLQGVCEYLGVPWDPRMLDYGRFDHGTYSPGLGDWKDKIRTGQVQPAREPPPPEEVPPELREVSAAWGYLPGGRAARPDEAFDAAPPAA